MGTGLGKDKHVPLKSVDLYPTIIDLSPMDIKQKVGQRIKQLRQELGLSQEGLGLEAGVDRTYVSDVENGRRNVSVDILERLIKALKINFAEFFASKEFKK